MDAAIKRYFKRTGFTELNVKSLFFDMDGVLFDSMPYHAASWIKVMNDVGIPFTEYDAYMNEGRTGASTITEYFIKYKKREPLSSEIDDMYAKKSLTFAQISNTKVMHGICDVLNEIINDGKSIFLVTGSGQKTLLNTLNEYFPGIFAKENMVTAYDVTKGKPDPEPYLIALSKSGVQKNEAMVIENSPLGVQAGSSAGLFTIAVNTGVLSDKVLYDYGADIVLPDMKALKEFYIKIKTINGSIL